jgi:TPR repeat protein
VGIVSKYPSEIGNGSSIPTRGFCKNKSLAVHYYKLSADQGNAEAQFYYGFMLRRGEGISMKNHLQFIILNYQLIKALQKLN